MSGENTQIRVLVAYQSQTGNTKKVAEAIYDAIPEPKTIKPIKEVKSLEVYDLTFLGFPVHGSGPNKQANAFLQEKTKDKKIALFVTHAAPEDAQEIPEINQKFREAASEAEIIDLFNCRGELGKMVKTFMRFAPDPQLREWARTDDSKGQPDAGRLVKAADFARKVIEKETINTPIQLSSD